MIKADEEVMPGSTWNKTQAREPVFILRAQDKLAPAVVKAWVALARIIGTKERKLSEAANLAVEMERWQQVHCPKVPD